MITSYNIPWSDDMIAEARSLYESGKYSNAHIGRIIGKSRNAVIGRANRGGWINPTPKSGGTKPGEKRPRRTAIFRPRQLPQVQHVVQQPTAPIDAPQSLDLTILELTKQTCKYAYGDFVPYSFCGHPTVDETSYCGFHRTLCHNEPPPRRGGQFAVKQFR